MAIAATLLSGLYFFNGGLSGLSFSSQLVSGELIKAERLALNTFSLEKWLLVASTGIALLAGLHTFKALLASGALYTATTKRIGNIAAGFAIIAGNVAIALGQHIGLQADRAIFSGGTMYVIDGAVLLLFAVIYLFAQHKQQIAVMKESLVFLLCTLPFLSLYFLTLWVIQYVHLPADYVQAGQGFVIPVGFSMGLLFLAIFYVIYGQATREHN